MFEHDQIHTPAVSQARRRAVRKEQERRAAKVMLPALLDAITLGAEEPPTVIRHAPGVGSATIKWSNHYYQITALPIPDDLD